MPFPTGKESAVSSDEEKINSLLGGGVTTTEEADPVAEDTSVADADMAPEAEEAEVDESGEDEGTAEEEGAEGEEEAGETDFELTEDDSDFSADAYARAAEHYSKRAGKTLDPNDPGDRFLLRELISRGQKIKELQAQPEEEESEEEEAPPAKAEDAPPAAPAKLTTEQIMQRMAEAEAYAKQSVVPEVSMQFATKLMNAFWPGKNIKIEQAQANAITEVFGTYGAMLIADAMPAIFQAVPNAVINGDPMMGKVREMAMRESALDELFESRDKAGAEVFPGLEKLLDSGEIKRQLNGPELKEAVYSRDPYKNLVAKIKVAYKLARGRPVDTKALTKAAARGRAQERERNVRVAAGKLPPGSSRGSFAAPGTAKNFINNLVGGSGSKFSRMLAEHAKK